MVITIITYAAAIIVGLILLLTFGPWLIDALGRRLKPPKVTDYFKAVPPNHVDVKQLYAQIYAPKQ